MSCFCLCFKKARPRYKQVVLALFPEDDSLDESDKKPAPLTPRSGSGSIGSAAHAHTNSAAAAASPLNANSVPGVSPASAPASAAGANTKPGANTQLTLTTPSGGESSGHAPPRQHSYQAASAAALASSHPPPHPHPPHPPHPSIGLPSDAGEESVTPQNVGDLIQYAHSFPPKLPLIGKYMLKLVKENIKKHRSRKVTLLLMTYQYLMEDTKLTLAVYDESVCGAISLCLAHPNPKLKMIGAQTFSKFMRYQADGSDYKKLDPFFDALVKLCQYTAPDDRHIQRTVRVYGLKAVKNMVSYNDPVRVLTHYNELVPAVLCNLPPVFPFPPDVTPAISLDSKHNQVGAAGGGGGAAIGSVAAAAAGGDDSLEAVAFDCFMKVAARPSAQDVPTLIEPVLRYLDESFWMSHSFAVQCMQLLSIAGNFSGDGLCYSILQHVRIHRLCVVCWEVDVCWLCLCWIAVG